MKLDLTTLKSTVISIIFKKCIIITQLKKTKTDDDSKLKTHVIIFIYRSYRKDKKSYLQISHNL